MLLKIDVSHITSSCLFLYLCEDNRQHQNFPILTVFIGCYSLILLNHNHGTLTSSKTGLFVPFWVLVCWMCPPQATFTVGFGLLPTSLRASSTCTRTWKSVGLSGNNSCWWPSLSFRPTLSWFLWDRMIIKWCIDPIHKGGGMKLKVQYGVLSYLASAAILYLDITRHILRFLAYMGWLLPDTWLYTLLLLYVPWYNAATTIKKDSG